ncbi:MULTISPECIES: dihydrolipoyllysine-residue acetyltransferase [Paraburkholderia]|uniref:Acetyltransferase component of pyruvate dehydrogenase complex n=1 Tax=Paraburkholderia hospita TaxID=169430 RepID=A0AAN1MI36_9BURK|nr:dihydrolipoyllysine-residue acetyltransferase [Paraburkholderia hospita]AUT67914.1 dihydrolipoyllysine-residue acetyltransferase [Paraburkholderia hospita]SEH90586.1 pyruvate dehydrogenase E2 component (dihydrolipoamide acetyltransferase) [Paraburkholderia hospita]
MSQAIEVKVPDIGDYKDIPVIEVLVKAGDTVEKEQSLVTLESDKATMDVPSPASGTVKEVKVKLGDTVSEGTLIVLLDGEGGAAAAKPAQGNGAAAPAAAPAPTPAAAPAPVAASGKTGGGVQEVKVPDIGDYKDVPVIEVGVKVGDRVEKEQSLVTLESDKATMDVPSPAAGIVKEIKVKVGDNVSEGTLIVLLEGDSGGAAAPAPAPAAAKHEEKPSDAPAAPSPAPAQPSALAQAPVIPAGEGGAHRVSHASPSVRKFARELGVDVSRVSGTGPKGRITQDDVTAFVKGVMTGQRSAPAAAAAPAGAGGGELGLLPWPKIDFTKFGPIDPKPLSRIKKISGANLHRNWVMIPHVTNNDEADITELEELRVKLNKENEKSGVKFTMLAFVIKAVVAALKKFPTFNTSLDGDNLVYKQYYNVGFAADTPNGLVVPVIRDADKKGLVDIAKEMAELSKLAREGKLKPDQMQGGCFSISSLGGIGGTNFTPIINAPEVAILGLSRGAMKPVWDGKQFVPRLMLPMSLSYDHRVIDGAEAARFNAYLGSILADFRRVIL